MGMKVIETNQTLNLAQYGLKAGDEITVICVGGGAGGGAARDGSSGLGYGGNAGFGGNGGVRASTSYGAAGGGGGAGGGYGAGGGGGGGASSANAYSYYGYNKGAGYGGGAGEYKMISHKLNETTVNSIVVTIGAGGIGGNNYFTNNTYHNGTNGGLTSFGSIVSANGGIICKGGAPGQDFCYSGISDRAAGPGGGGGEGGYILPLRMYGGSGGKGGDTRVVPGSPVTPTMIMSAGGGGGSGSMVQTYSNSSAFGVLAQSSQYGGHGGAPETPGGQGFLSKGSGVVVVLW